MSGYEKDYVLGKFNLQEIQHDSVCVFLGKRKTGKTFLLREILYNHRSIPVGTCISGTEGANKFFTKLMPTRFIHRRFSPEILKKALQRQEHILNVIDEEEDIEKKKRIDPRAFLVLDDCLYDKKWLRHDLIREIFMNGRHFHIMLLLTMQYPLGIGPELRTNVDYTFIFREPSLKVRKIIYENYASIIPTFQLFNKILDKCTENFECLVIKNMSTSNKVEDAVFWYKAEEKDNFKIGDIIFWKEQALRQQEEKKSEKNKRILSSDDDDSESMDKYNSSRNKRMENVRVKKSV